MKQKPRDVQFETLMTAFGALSTAEQMVPELLSVYYEAISLSKAEEWFEAVRRQTDSLRSKPAPDWRSLLERLRSAGLLRLDGGRFVVNPLIVEAVTRHADRKGRLQGHLEALYALEPALDHERPEFAHSYRFEDAFRKLRLALHRNDAESFADLHRSITYLWRRPDHDDRETRLYGAPVDRDWLLSRQPLIRDHAIYTLVSVAYARFRPLGQLMEPLLEIARQAPQSALGDLAMLQTLLCGDFEAAEELVSLDESPNGELYRGWMRLIRGQRHEAVAHFEAAVKEIMQATRRRKLTLAGWSSAMYVFAVLGTEDRPRLTSARKLVGAPGADTPQPLLDGALRCALLLAEGKVEAAQTQRDLFESMASSYQRPLDELFVMVVRCWCDSEQKPQIKHRAELLEQAAAQAGYRWLALEFRRVRMRAAGDTRAIEPDENLGTVALLDSLPSASPWERSLAALEQLKAASFTKASKRPAESRLIWRVAVGTDEPGIRAVEQKRTGAGKWSKGRTIALRRLHERKDVGFLTPQDFAVCETIVKTPIERNRFAYFCDPGKAFVALIGHPLVFSIENPAAKVEIVRSEPHLEVKSKRGTVRMKLSPDPPSTGNVVLQWPSNTRAAVSVFDPEHLEIAAVLGTAGLSVPAEATDRIGKAIHSVSSLVTVQADRAADSVGSTEVVADSTPQFLMTPFEDGLRAEPVVRPLGDTGPALYPGRGGATVFAFVDGRAVRGQRNLAGEKRDFNAAVGACPALGKAASDGTAWVIPDPYGSLELLEQLHLLGDAVKLAWPEGERLKLQGSAATDRLALKIRRSQDWFGIDGKLELDSGLVLTLHQVLDLMEHSPGRFLQLREKQFVALSERFRKRIEELSALVDRKGRQLRLHSSRALALEPIVEEAGTVDADAAWARRLQDFREAQALDPEVPSTLQAELRDYQVEGFKWAARLAAWGAGACLADDMGLGKTLQALTVAVSRAAFGPTLVVAPTSVCPNWIDETRRFAPTLNPVLFGPGNRQQMLDDVSPFDVVVCSYGLLHQEVELLAAVQWTMITLDEAQAIKNRETMRSKAAMRLAGDFRMITTGTPIENHLGEIHNLFNFINPGLLGSADAFVKQFANPIHNAADQAAKARLKRLIQPFILRRTKSAVLDELPARTEITLRIEMEREERALYEALRQRAVAKLEEEGADGAQKARHIEVLAEITKLRRACCHPQLVMPESGIASSKLEAFLLTVEDLMRNRHKALVFSQFVTHLDIVRAELDQRGIDYRYLDGSTPARQRKQEVDAFQAGSGSLFLISLRAGGQGLNLTAADYVVHLDPWWNPAVEDQASDRAHRIGQTRPVTIYRLVMKDSIEEKIVDLHRSKRDLADNLLAGTDMSGKMSADELLNLLREQ